MTYRRTLLSLTTDHLDIADEVFYYAWSCGLDRKRAFDLSGVVALITAFGKVEPDAVWDVVNGKLSLKDWPRKRSQVRRYVVRNRRKFHHDQALIRRHEQEILRPPFYGLRCAGCNYIPPQPGEIMEEESDA